MKRYRERREAKAGFGAVSHVEQRVVELEDDATPEIGAVQVDDTTELHDWRPAAQEE